MSDNVIDFYDNTKNYIALCCRPGGRCTTGASETVDEYLSEEDEQKLTDFINNDAASMREVLDYWHYLKTAAATRKAH